MKNVLSLVLLFCSIFIIQAQDFVQDKAVRVGKLDNGLTYYIRHNQEPKERAFFYIAQKVGSMQRNKELSRNRPAQLSGKNRGQIRSGPECLYGRR